MKHFLSISAILCTFFTCAHWLPAAAPVAVGDPVATVVAELGEPPGEIDFGSRVVYLYDNGRVEFRDGVVTSVNLLSAAEYAARQEREARELESYLVREERFQQQRAAAAERIRADRRSDAYFLLQPASMQLDFWRKLQQQFPQVSFASEIETLAEEIREERLRLAREAEIRQLAERTAAAERRASEAESIARQAQQRASQLPIVVEPNFIPIYYPRPRPPTVYYINTCPYTRQGLNSSFRADNARLPVRLNRVNHQGRTLFTEATMVREVK